MPKEHSVQLSTKQILQIIKEMVAYENTEGEKKVFWINHEEIIGKLEEVLKKEEKANKRASS